MSTTNVAPCGQGNCGSVQQHPSFQSVTNQDVQHEADLQVEVVDQITILTSKGPRLIKTWEADGTITGHGRAKRHTVRTVPVSSIREAAEVFSGLRKQPTSCIIRGEYIGDEAAALVPDPNGEREVGYVLRQMAYFNDPAHHLIMFDVDGYVPKTADPVMEPEEAVREWIRECLPLEFLEITCYWHLSSSAGHPTKLGTLRAHLMFWLSRKMTSPEAAAYVTMTKIPVDRAPLHVVQANYTADPVFASGVVDPVPLRAGLLEGWIGDVVDVAIDEGALAVATFEMSRGTATSGGGEGGTCLDPRLKKGLIGAFCKAFTPEDVLMAEWFEGNFERVNDRRWTWLDGGGSAEGAYITDDRQRLVNTHNSALQNTIGKGLNSWDLTRIYKFGALDDAVPEDDRWNWDDIATHPSEVAMRKFAKSLPEVRAEMDNGPEDNNPFERDDSPDTPPPVADDDEWGKAMYKAMKRQLHAMGLTKEEIEKIVDTASLKAAWRGCFYSSGQGKLYLINKAGDLVQFVPADWATMVEGTFGQFLVREELSPICKRLGEATAIPQGDVEEKLRKGAWAIFAKHVKLYRQKGEIQYKVDMFAPKASITLTQTAAAVTYAHKNFQTRSINLPNGVAEAIVSEYREYFSFFDTILDLFLHARFATDRRQAFLWMHCMAGWGKGFLLDGVLGKDGLKLIAELSVKDIERAFEGSPCGFQAADVIWAWCLAVDEFKQVKGELKMLNNRIMAAPKNQLRFSCAVYVKLFLSAESVDSLAGSDGVEAQFADRFALYAVPEGSRTINDLPLFNEHGKTVYRDVIANYAAEKLNAGVERMRALGQVAASKAGDDWLEQFHQEHGIVNTHGLLSDNLPEIAADIVSLLNDWALHQEREGTAKSIDLLPSALKVKLSQVVKVVTGRAKAGDEPGRLIVTGGLSAVVKDYIAATKDRSQQLLVSHKTNAIIELIAGRKAHATRSYYDEDGNQKTTRGAVLPLTKSPVKLAAAAAFESDDIMQ